MLRNAEKKEAKKFNSERNVIKKGREKFFVSYSAKMPINMYEIEKWKNCGGAEWVVGDAAYMENHKAFFK